MKDEEILLRAFAEAGFKLMIDGIKDDIKRFDKLEYKNKLKLIVILANEEKEPELLDKLSDRLIEEKGITYLEDLMSLLEEKYGNPK